MRWYALTAALLVGTVISSARAATVAPTCDALAASPSVASDGVVFCVARDIPRPDVGPVGVAFYRSNDRGRTWVRAAATGLTWSSASSWRDIVVSPRYADDHAVFVQDNTQGLFVTTDAGATFTLADPLVAFDDAQPSIGPARVAPLSSVPFAGPVLYAGHGTAPMLIQPPLRTPVAGVPPTVTLRRFLTLAGLAPSSAAFAVAENDNGSSLAKDYSIELYACDSSYACATRLASFPRGMALVDAYLTTGFESRHGVVVTLERTVGGTGDPFQVWTSTDAGIHFARNTAVERVMAREAGRDIAGVRGFVDTIDGIRQYLLVDIPERGAARALYVSNDGGRSWSRRAAARFGQGPLPVSSGHSPLYQHRLWLLPGGAIAVVGQPAGSYVGNAFACSVDGGRRWQAHC